MRCLTIDWYEQLARPLLFHMDAETAHHFALRLLKTAPKIPGGLRLLRRFAPPARPRTLFGLRFRNPIGLAAGFDKNGIAIPAWEALGFGFVEIGTVTARPQSGNSRPRIFRYASQEALINRLGFNNDGADVVGQRLQRLRASRLRPSIPIGINIGKSKVTPLQEAAQDYLYSFRRLHGVADYVAINVSSPNTPGLRSLQEDAALRQLLEAVAGENAGLAAPKPILLKVAPDLPDESWTRIAAVCEEFALAGIIATNTTLDHLALAREVDEAGGLSGAPLRARSTKVIELLRQATKLPIVGVGGISDARSAQEKLRAGADLLQIYTGLIYRGPGLLGALGLG